MVHSPNDISRIALDHSTFFKLRQKKKRVVEIFCDFIGGNDEVGQVRELIVGIGRKQLQTFD